MASTAPPSRTNITYGKTTSVDRITNVMRFKAMGTIPINAITTIRISALSASAHTIQ
jgi:hypothetical protein